MATTMPSVRLSEENYQICSNKRGRCAVSTSHPYPPFPTMTARACREEKKKKKHKDYCMYDNEQ